MKKNNGLRKIVISISAVVLLALIGFVTFIIINGNNSIDKTTIIKNNVSVITEDTNKGNQPINVTDDELVFNTDPGYPKGEVIVAGIVDSAPSGFIRKVVETTKVGNQYVVKTEYGELTDVFEKAHIVKTFALTDSGAEEIDPNSIKPVGIKAQSQDCPRYGYTAYRVSNNKIAKDKTLSLLDNDTEYQFAAKFNNDLTEGISVEGEVGFSVWVEIEIDINFENVIFGIVAHNAVGGEFSIDCDAEANKDFEKDIFSTPLSNFQFFIGFIPVVITNELKASIEGQAGIEGSISTNFEIKAENSRGFRYTSELNKTAEIKEDDFSSDGLQWNTQANAKGGLSVGVYLHLITKLYDCVGADISAGIEGSAEGKVRVSTETSPDGLNYAGSLDLAIGPKIRGDIVVTIPIIDEKLAEMPIFTAELEPFWKKHWEFGTDEETDIQQVITFPDKNFEAAVREAINKPTGDITYADVSGITRLDVSGEFGGSEPFANVFRNIKSLSGIEYLTALEWLDCNTAQLTELDLSHNTALTFLDCSNNSLTKLNISNNSKLTELYCYMNQLTELDLSNNPALIKLDCQENNLTRLDVSKNITLDSIDCGYNPLTELDVSNNTALTYIGCDIEYSSDWASYSPTINIIGLDESRTFIGPPQG